MVIETFRFDGSGDQVRYQKGKQLMSIDGRRPHWRATHADPDDETDEAHQCFAYAPHAGEWLTEQLHHRPVVEVGGLYECIDATEWLARLTDGVGVP